MSSHSTPYASYACRMEENLTKSTSASPEVTGSLGCADGHLLPIFPVIPAVCEGNSALIGGYLLPNFPDAPNRAFLDGNFARRAHPTRTGEYVVWDTELAGFGLRIRPSGSAYWTVRLRHRGKYRRVTFGRVEDVEARFARAQARRLLAEVALDGLPKRTAIKKTPRLSDYVDTYWTPIARYWKPSTAQRNLEAWRRDLAPVFGEARVAEVLPTDVIRWRDDCAGSAEARYNRAVPVLGSLFKFAEALHFRRKGSNPCRGLPHYPRDAMERYLSPLEYRRLGAALLSARRHTPPRSRSSDCCFTLARASARYASPVGMGPPSPPYAARPQDRSQDDLAKSPGARDPGRRSPRG